MLITYFAPRNPPPPAHLDDRAYAAEHCKQTTPGAVADLDLTQLEAACRAAARVGRKGDAGYIIGCDCSTTRKEGAAAGVVLIDQDEGCHEPDWAALDEYQGFAWTTASHRPDKPAWRVVIPLAEPFAHGKLRCPFKGGVIRNRTQPAFLPTHRESTDAIEWRVLRGTKRLDGRELGAEAQTFADCDTSLLGAAFTAAGHVIGEQPNGLLVRCPWVHRHSDGQPGGTVVFHADPDDNGFGKFHCSRTECMKVGRTSRDALAMLTGIPAVAHEVAHWLPPGLEGAWTRQAAPAPQPQPIAPAPETTASPMPPHTQDLSGLQLAPSGWPWVLRQSQWCWLHSLTPGVAAYGGMIAKADLRLQVRRSHSHVVLLTTEKGGDIPEHELERRYTARVAELKATYLARENTWDAEQQQLTLAALKWARLPAAFDPDVDVWLRAMGGAAYARLAQWLAAVVALNRPAPALYIHGNHSVGKSLLARGIARLWQTEAAPFKEALESFNEATASCPLLFSDEGFPDGMSFNVFREMVTEYSRRVNEKFKPKYPVEGCIRIILAANNDQVLRYQRTGTLTSADIEAINDRLLVIRAGAEAKAAIERFDATSFVDDNRIAKHVLWLAQTIELEPKHERMCAKPSGAGPLLDAIQGVKYGALLRTMAPALNGKAVRGVMLRPDDTDTIWVSVRALKAAADTECFMAREQTPKDQDVRDFVNAFRNGPKVQLQIDNDRHWWHPLGLARVRAQVETLD